MQFIKYSRAFTLIEMMVVVSIIAILALMATPSMDSKVTRAQVIESMELIKQYKENVNAIYQQNKFFPKNNQDAGMPKPELLLGNFVERIELIDGAFHVTFGSKAHSALKNKILSMRPIVVKGSPDSPNSWVCGGAAIPEGMMAIGNNLTNIDGKYLPINCF